MKNIVVVSAALALASLSTVASASENSWFVRGELGRSHASADVSGFGSDSDNDTAYSVRGGYWFNPNVAVEAFYSDFYDKSISDGIDSASGKLTAIGLGVVGKKNFGADGNGFFLDGRAGITRGNLDVSVSGVGSESDNSTKPYFGVGVGYDFTQNFGLSLNFDRQRGSGRGVTITANTLTAGAEFRF